MSNLKTLKGQLKNTKDEMHKLIKADFKIDGLLRKQDMTNEEKSELERTSYELWSRYKDLKFDLLSVEYYMLCLVPSSYIPKKNIRAVHGVNGDNYINVRCKEILKEVVNYYSGQLWDASTDIRDRDEFCDRAFRYPTDDVIYSDVTTQDIDTGFVHERLLGNAEAKFEVSKSPKKNEAKLII